MHKKKRSVLRSAGTLILGGALLFSSIPVGLHQADAQAAFSDTLTAEKIAGYSTGLQDKDGGVAEIVKYNPDNQKFYVINGKNQTIDIVSLANLDPKSYTDLQKEKSINIGDAVNSSSFQYGDLTSIDVNTNKKVIAAAVQDKDYKENGKIVVMDYDGNVKKTYDVGVQPDMVTMTDDGTYILSADEAEPRDGRGQGIVDPDGSVSIINTATGKVEIVKFTDTSVIDKNVHIRQGSAVNDFEPEYIALSSSGSKAYVTLQENNAIATIDVKTGKVLSVRSLGFKDHSLPGNELDARRNGEIGLEQLPILGVYMPDGIAYFEAGGKGYLVTGNEGDATEWGDEDEGTDYVNIADFEDWKKNIKHFNPELFKGFSKDQAQSKFNAMVNGEDYDKLEVLTDRGDDAIYTLGGRSFSIWDADTMKQVYDSGSDFERITAERLPDYFNWSNDDDEMDKRSAKKGPEPEDVKIGTIGGNVYAFVGLERISGVMTYNISNPNQAAFANYLNTRDFSEKIAGDVAPEGLAFVPADNSPTGQALVLVGNEVSGTVSVSQYTDPALEQDITAANDAVEKAESSKTQENVNAARALVAKLPDGKQKTDLTARLNKVQQSIDKDKAAVQALSDATAAVEKAENSKSQKDVDAARKLVKALPDGSNKSTLLKRLDTIRIQEDTSKAEQKKSDSKAADNNQKKGSEQNQDTSLLPKTGDVFNPWTLSLGCVLILVAAMLNRKRKEL